MHPIAIPIRLFLARCAAYPALLLLALPANAVQKCTAPDGRISYQDNACPSRGKTLVLEEPFRTLGPTPPRNADTQRRAAESAQATRATASGQPYIGMTGAALERLMGPPDRVTRSRYGNGMSRDRVEYQREGRLLRVLVRDGRVVEVQDRAAAPASRRTPCPTAQDIRNMETIAGNRTDPPERIAENRRLLKEMRACR